MEERFITKKRLSASAAFASLTKPLFSTPQSRIAFYAERDRRCEVVMDGGPTRIDLLPPFDWICVVRRGPERVQLDFPAGCAVDEDGFEYQLRSRLDCSFVVRDEAEAIARVVQDFEAEYAHWTGVLQAHLAHLVTRFVARAGRLHMAFDVACCAEVLAQEVAAAKTAFDIFHVYGAGFGDPAWKDHPARNYRMKETEAKAQHRARLNQITREGEIIQARAPVDELQRQCSQRSQEFRLKLEAMQHEHKLAQLRATIEVIGLDRAIAEVDPATFALLASHAERMDEREKEQLRQFKDELVAILKQKVVYVARP